MADRSHSAAAVDPTSAAAHQRFEDEAAAFFRAAPPLRDRDAVAASLAGFIARHSRSVGKSLSIPNFLSPASVNS